MLFETVWGGGNSNQFFVAQLDGVPAREVSVAFLAQKGLEASSAAWYPDGKKITFWVSDSSPTPSFWTIPIEGGSGSKLEIVPAIQKQLADAAGEREGSEQLGSYTFSWSPSGGALYFEQMSVHELARAGRGAMGSRIDRREDERVRMAETGIGRAYRVFGVDGW